MGNLAVKGLAYQTHRQQIFKNINMTIEQGAIVGIIGPSGVGKTSLLYLIAGLLKPSVGSIMIDDEVLTSESVFVSPEKRKVGLVFQEYAVFPHMTVEQNLLFGMKSVPKNQKKQKLDNMLEMMRLIEYRARYPHELSGGQQQRTAIARTLLGKTRVLLLDEPYCNLDQELSRQISSDMSGYLNENKITTILVSHNISDISYMCGRIYCLCEMGILPFDPI